jgi:hypothetical protein
MILSKRATVCLALFFAIVLMTTSSFAAHIFPVGTPYTDTHSITWEGITPFTSPANPDLTGYVKWSVYAPGAFPFSGYAAKNVVTGEYTYVYQVFGQGSDAISNFSLLLDNPADHLDTFRDAANGLDYSTPLNTFGLFDTHPDSASWYFDGIGDTGNSEGLVFASTTAPLVHQSIIQDHGTQAFPVGIPAPGPYMIPEPGTFTLLIAGLGIALAVRRFRRR